MGSSSLPIFRVATEEDFRQLERFSLAAPFLANRFLVAVQDTQVVAFLAWRQVAPDESEILQLETLALFRKKGVARRLLRTLKQITTGSIFLEVRESNLAAQHLYHSEGFTDLLVRNRYYSFPTENGIVLKFHSC